MGKAIIKFSMGLLVLGIVLWPVTIFASEIETVQNEYGYETTTDSETTDPETLDLETTDSEILDSETTGTTDTKIDDADTSGLQSKDIVKTNEWYTDETGNTYYYDENGIMLVSCVKNIDGKWYGFNENGVMRKNTIFGFPNSTLGKTIFYRAKEDGTLYCSEWYSDSYGKEYYGGDCARYADKFLEEDGYTYYFTSSGSMLCDHTITIDNIIYRFDKDGHLIDERSKDVDGWWTNGYDWYYLRDGQFIDDELLIEGNKVYYFYYDGCLVTNKQIDYYDKETETYTLYYAGKDGALLTGMIVSEEGFRYYAHEDFSLAVNEVIVYENEVYVFGDHGRAYSNQWFEGYYIGDDCKVSRNCILEIDGKVHCFNEYGESASYDNGWVKFDSQWYYVKDGSLLRNTVSVIGGVTYYFDAEGVMADSEVVCDELTGNTYIVNPGGAVVTKAGWYKFQGEWYHVKDATGVLTEGWYVEGSYTYYLWPEMVTSMITSIDEELWKFDASGYAALISEDGFYNEIYYDDQYQETQIYTFYVKNGQLVKGWQDIDGYTYYFTEDYVRLEDIAVEIDGCFYVFDAEGKLYKNQWCHSYKGTTYHDSEGRALLGDQLIDGIWYYFDPETGYMQTGVIQSSGKYYLYGVDGKYISPVYGTKGWVLSNGEWYYLEDGQLLTETVLTYGSDVYYLDETGKMVTDTIVETADSSMYADKNGILKTGWIMYEGDMLYANEGCTLYKNQWLDDIYYFDNNYRMVTGELYMDNTVYVFGADGKLISQKYITNGWTLVNGTYYYYKDWEPYNGWVGNYYIRDGIMLTEYLIGDGTDYYYVGYDGLVQKGWVLDGEYYADSTGRLAQGWKLIDGDWYYFDWGYLQGQKMTGVQIIGNEVHSFNSEGVWLGAIPKNTYGWKLIDNQWYYFNAGFPCEGVQTLSGADYLFGGYDARLIKNEITFGYGIGDGLKNYYVNEDGCIARYTGWQEIHGNIYYFNDDYTIATGWVLFDNQWYYMDPWDGLLVGIHFINDTWREFDSDGKYVGIVDLPNGWNKINGQWYYLVNGKPVVDCLKTIGNKTYAFDSEGIMLSDCVHNGRYFNWDGAMKTTEGWVLMEDGLWCYVTNGGKVAVGTHIIKGRTYYFDSYGYWIEV